MLSEYKFNGFKNKITWIYSKFFKKLAITIFIKCYLSKHRSLALPLSQKEGNLLVVFISVSFSLLMKCVRESMCNMFCSI
jgi:hypothetical protein